MGVAVTLPEFSERTLKLLSCVVTETALDVKKNLSS